MSLDLTTYDFKQDTDGDYTTHTANLLVANSQRNDADGYVAWDYTATPIGLNEWTLEWAFRYNAASATGAVNHMPSLTSVLGGRADVVGAGAGADAIFSEVYANDTSTYLVFIRTYLDGASSLTSPGALSFNIGATIYYATMYVDAAASTYGDVVIDFYTDAARTTLHGTESISLTSGYAGMTFDYMQIQSGAHTAANARYLSSQTSDVVLDLGIGTADVAASESVSLASTSAKTSGASSATSSSETLTSTYTKIAASDVAFDVAAGMASTGVNAALVDISAVEDIVLSATSKKIGASTAASVGGESLTTTYTATPNVNYAVITWRVMDTATPPTPITGLSPTVKVFDPINLTSYDFNDDTFKATASCTTLTATLTERDATYYPGYYDYQLNPENLGLADQDKEYQLDLVAVDGVDSYYGEQVLIIRDGVEQLGGAGIAGVPAAVVAADNAQVIDGTITSIQKKRMELAVIAGDATVPSGDGAYEFQSQAGTPRIAGTVTAGTRAVTTKDGT